MARAKKKDDTTNETAVVEETVEAVEAAPEPAVAAKPVAKSKKTDDGRWKELGFKTPEAYERYKAKFSS